MTLLTDDPGQLVLRLGAAILAGAALGFDRELHHKPAGLRTLALVSLGAALAAIIGISLASPGNTDSMQRVLQGVLTGIGFIGAGVILRQGNEESVRGLTTAASIWVTAGLGVACGLGYWRLVLVSLTLTLLVLSIGRRVEERIHIWFGS